ncbi:NmrA family NAD(P)-binding protein [Flavobacterium sp. DSR2-3-3]|uniref:NmrA family NAD(P)-binding protein n=1 Tax=Flavobacterium sp. DSR2-3-3 TaxID=2804632 RepID=UPI003CE9A15C
MTKVLITGATGNVGTEVIKSLQNIDHQLEIYAGVRNLNEDRLKLSNYKVNFSLFDFTDVETYKTALNGCEILFLLRPPQISEVEKYFKPIIDTCKKNGVKHIVFLSVQGVEKSKMIPHHKIEKLIVDSKIPYTFLRPAYFMQNFTTTLHNDLVNKKRIYLPAGNAKFTLVDVRDIGAVSATILTNISEHINKSYELTCKVKLTFLEMARILSDILGIEIQYISPNLISFFLTKRKEKTPTMFILVMIMLHYFPRFQKEPETTNWVEKITNRQPTTFEQFINDNKKALTE